jgi:hypothetical protein
VTLAEGSRGRRGGARDLQHRPRGLVERVLLPQRARTPRDTAFNTCAAAIRILADVQRVAAGTTARFSADSSSVSESRNSVSLEAFARAFPCVQVVPSPVPSLFLLLPYGV